MKAYFITNRELKGSSFQENVAPRGQIRCGEAQVHESRGEYKVERVTTYPEKGPTDSDLRAGIRRWRLLGSETLFEDIRGSIANDEVKEILIFLHGGSNTFESCIETAARLSALYARDSTIIPVAFSYPTNDDYDPINYYSDIVDARASGPHIARSIQRLIAYLKSVEDECRCRVRIHLLAHSLGNHALSAAVAHIEQYRVFGGGRVYDNIILAHADEDEDALTTKGRMLHLSRLAEEIVVYFDKSDALLRLSDGTEAFDDRLGRVGPQPHPGRRFNGCGIAAVDCRRVQFDLGRDSKRHRHYYLSSTVVADIKAQIHRDAKTERQPTDDVGEFFELVD